ncbi:MAG: L-arabinose isomerase [Spirochaetota bacterium]
MNALKEKQVWFVTGSQHLYGAETLRQVAKNAKEIADSLAAEKEIPVSIVFKQVVTTASEIERVLVEANSAAECIGLIFWMHTFSPAKMWIAGLSRLNKPFVHLHTQYNRDIPWSTIDMDFMNLNQAAHGDREFGFLCTRMKKRRKVVVGFWKDPRVVHELAVWSRAAAGYNALRTMKVARFGDNMREVAVTEGDKVEAQMKLGVSVNGFGIGDLAATIQAVSDADIKKLIDEYQADYDVEPALLPSGAKHASLKEAARIEAGMRAFLTRGGFSAFTTTFEDLYGLGQLPGLAVQRLMADGFGFGAEGDWKTAALLAALKVMDEGLFGGTSFMEDYTYHLDGSGMVLGAHMLEVCPSIATAKPSLSIHPLGIGGKADPVRLIFTAAAGEALNASLIDMGNRFRLILNAVATVLPSQEMPKLPVARALWKPHPNLPTAAQAWILAGGAHHTVYSRALTMEHLIDLAEMAGIECLCIDADTDIRSFKNELALTEVLAG